MVARTLSMMLTSSLLLVGGAGAASAHRPPPSPRADVDVQLVCDGSSCDEVRHQGRRYVVGEQGQRYVIALHNRSALWVEAVVTVDGRNIVDGHRASSRSRGYLLPPYQRVEIEGWRVSSAEVAAFRFTSVGDSYAGRVGDAHAAGTVRVEVYPERGEPTWIPRPHPHRRGALEDEVGTAPRSGAAKAERAPSGDGSRYWHDDDGQNLGTQFGESRWQPVEQRDFQRANPTRPAQTVTVWYDDHRGLVARGVIGPPRWIEEPTHWVAPPPPRSW